MVTVLAVVGAVTLVVLAGRRGRELWVRHRAPRRVEQCCQCGKRIVSRQIHTIVTRPTDDEEIGVGGGWQTAVAADVCRSCCPGGCVNHRHGRLAS